jgi:hypothetical protein
MNAETEISTEGKLETVSEHQKPVAVYTVNFANVVGNFTEKRLVRRRKSTMAEKSVEKSAEKSFSKKIFNWRNAVPVAAILAIGVLHFALQISVIRPEVSENHTALEIPPVKVEPARALPLEAVPAVVEIKKPGVAAAPQKTVSRVKPRQLESAPSIAPTKPVVRKKEAGETRAERLRRAERLLTGI